MLALELDSAKPQVPLLRQLGRGQKLCLPRLGGEFGLGAWSEGWATEERENRSHGPLPLVLLQPEGPGEYHMPAPVLIGSS